MININCTYILFTFKLTVNFVGWQIGKLDVKISVFKLLSHPFASDEIC